MFLVVRTSCYKFASPIPISSKLLPTINKFNKKIFLSVINFIYFVYTIIISLLLYLSIYFKIFFKFTDFYFNLLNLCSYIQKQQSPFYMQACQCQLLFLSGRELSTPSNQIISLFFLIFLYSATDLSNVLICPNNQSTTLLFTCATNASDGPSSSSNIS